MILAISIIFMPIAVDKRSFAPKGILLIAAVCALFLLSRSGNFSIAGAAVLLLIFLLYITENIRSAKRDAGAEETGKAPASDRRSIVLNILRIVGGAACIVVGSQLLVSNGQSHRRVLGRVRCHHRRHHRGHGHLPAGAGDGCHVPHQEAVVHVRGQRHRRQRHRHHPHSGGLFLVYGGKLPVSAQNIYLDFPVAIVVTLIAIIPTIVCRRFQRWQGVLMLAVYVAYLVVVTTGLDWYLALAA